MTAMLAPGGAIVVLRRDAAWAALAVGILVVLLSVAGVLLAWRAARRARRAVDLIEELRRSVRRPQPPVVPGPIGGQVPVMVPPETVFPEYPAPPEPPAPEAVPPPEKRATAHVQRPPEERPVVPPKRPPPDISRYEVRLPGGDTRAQQDRTAGPPSTHAPTVPPAPAAPSAPPGPEQPPAPPGYRTGEPPAENRHSSAADETGVLLRALQDPDPFVRAKALGGLTGRPGVDAAVTAALADDYPIVRREAVRALRTAGSSQAVRALVDVVSHDPSAEVREEAVAVLAELLQRGASENL